MTSFIVRQTAPQETCDLANEKKNQARTLCAAANALPMCYWKNRFEPGQQDRKCDQLARQWKSCYIKSLSRPEYADAPITKPACNLEMVAERAMFEEIGRAKESKPAQPSTAERGGYVGTPFSTNLYPTLDRRL